MTIKQNGFGAVEAIIILVVIAVIGLGGWYVWSKNNSQDSNDSTNTSQSEETYNDEVEQPATVTYDAAKVTKIKDFELASDSLKADLVGKFYDQAKKPCDAENAYYPAEQQHKYYLVVKTMVRDEFAAVGFCPSGGTSILAKVNGEWQTVGNLADTPGCDVIDQYKISKEITETCMVSATESREVTYQ